MKILLKEVEKVQENGGQRVQQEKGKKMKRKEVKTFKTITHNVLQPLHVTNEFPLGRGDQCPK